MIPHELLAGEHPYWCDDQTDYARRVQSYAAKPHALLDLIITETALPVVEVQALDWDVIDHAVDAPAIRARMHGVIERVETLMDSAQGPSMLFDSDRAHEWIMHAAKLAVRLMAQAPRALFQNGLLVAHDGFSLSDLHTALAETGDWKNPACLSDFVWGQAHPKARKKMPNRFSRGRLFGFEDFADFCALSTRLGRPVTHIDPRLAACLQTGISECPQAK